jgi:hypothetical protein
MLNRLTLIALSLIFLIEAAAAQRRTALVVGNSSYVAASSLKNPSNDATAVAKSLRDLDFSVTLALDLDKEGFERQVRDFASSLDGASAAVLFYAGHGLQVEGRNYLVPVDAKVANEADLPFQLVSLDIVLQKLAGHRITSIVFLDACRDNPLGEKLSKALGERASAVGHGLANVHASAGTLISFSTQPGNTALDGGGRNSPFTKALLHHVATPNVDVLAMLRQVRRDVIEETRRKQIPWDNSSLVDEFMFRPSSGNSAKRPNEIPENDSRREPKPKPADDDSAIPLPPDIRPVLNGRPPVHACDNAAASATDPERVVPGKTIGELNGAEGVRACRAALALYPGTPRFEFQLARSLHKIEAYPEAAQRYRSLVERGYFAALTNYGWMLNFGHGVRRDPVAAVRLYMLAAQQGDTFGMYNVAMAYDSGSGLPYKPAQAASWIYAALRLGHTYSIDQMSGQAAGWTRDFRAELQRLLRHAGVYSGPTNGIFGPDVARAVRMVQSAPFAPMPGGDVPTKRFDPQSIPVNAPVPR